MHTMNVMKLFSLEGKKALITGGAKGLGKVMAEALAQAGADVAITSRHINPAMDTATEIAESTGRNVVAFEADVSKSSEIDRLFPIVTADFGNIDILINNAGINLRGDASKLAEADWDTVIELNLKAPFLCARKFAPPMCERKWGRIINMGSILSVIGIIGRAPYSASKGGLLNLTRTLALEWAREGVTVNAICPGPFGTEMNKPLLDDPIAYQQFVSKIPIGRWGEMHEIAGAAVFLASDASSFVTGSALFVDGGWTAQ